MHPPEHIALKTWDPSCDTFVPRAVYCWNSVDVRRTAGGSLECKCLGHPVGPDPMSLAPEEAVVYADNSSLELKPKASVLSKLMLSATELARKHGVLGGSSPSSMTFGFDGTDNGVRAPTDELESEVLKLGLAYFWAVQREPLTSLTIAFNINEVEVGPVCERMYMLAWVHPTNKPAVYTKPWRSPKLQSRAAQGPNKGMTQLSLRLSLCRKAWFIVSRPELCS